MADHLQPGSRIWQYEIDKFIGAGAFADTYLAHHVTMTRRKVAIKQLKKERAKNPDTVKRFVHEAYAMGELLHPNIVTIFELIDPKLYPSEDRYSIVMEYMDGGTLDEWLEREDHPLRPIHNAIKITQNILQGLSAAHQEKIIHRDLKPANILLNRDGSIVKIADWGLAHLDDLKMTQLGSRMGTPQYMSPEQAKGDSYKVDARSDLYAIGAILYEMLTGRPYLDLGDIIEKAMALPPRGGNPRAGSEEAMFMAIFSTVPESPKKFRPEIPDMLANIILKSLAKAPQERYQSGEDFIEALGQVSTGPKKKTESFIPSHNSEQIASLLVRARQLRIEENYKEAKVILEKAQEIMPNHPGVCLELARIFNLSLQPEEAIRILELANEQNPDNYIILRDLGNTYSKIKNSAQALSLFQKALALNPNQSDVERKVRRLQFVTRGKNDL